MTCLAVTSAPVTPLALVDTPGPRAGAFPLAAFDPAAFQVFGAAVTIAITDAPVAMTITDAPVTALALADVLVTTLAITAEACNA